MVKIRSATIDLIEILLRQGLINPIQTVPYLLALQGDVAAPDIRSKALKLFIAESEKRPDIMRQRVRAGVKQAYLFQQQVYPKTPPTAIMQTISEGGGIDVECIFDRVFRESIRSSRVQRQGLYQSLLGLFEGIGGDSEVSGDSKKSIKASKGGPEKLKKQSFVELLPLLSFSAQVLAHLPYNNIRDPLFIVYFCSSYIVHGEQLCDRFADFLRPHGLASEDKFDSFFDSEDDLEKAAKAKKPSKVKAACQMSNGDFDLNFFAELCAEGSALVLLLRLRNFMRSGYNLSEQRISGYLPVGQKETIADKGISGNIKSCFNATIISFSDGDKTPNKSISIDALILQYAEFRSCLRKAHIDQDGGHDGGRKRKRNNSSESSDEDMENEDDE